MPFKAFISYSHSGDDEFALALQAALHKFAKPFYKPRALQVFRDKSDLSANPALWPLIRKALDESEYFILLASPASAGSKWVQQEIGHWLEIREGSVEKLLIILTDGEIAWDGEANDFDWGRTTALPRDLAAAHAATLRGKFREEPFFLDCRWAKTATDLSLLNPDFLDRVATLAATLHGRPKSEMVGEDVSQHRRYKFARTVAGALLLAFATLAGAAAVYAEKNRRAAERSRDETSEALRQMTAAQEVAEARRVQAEAALDAERKAKEKESEALRAEAEARASAEERRAEAERQRAVAENRRREAERQRQMAVSRQLAAQALNHLDGGFDLSPLLGVAALGISDNLETRSSLLRVLQHNPRLQTFLHGHTRAVNDVAFSRDGSRMASAGADGAVIIRDVADGRLADAEPLTGHRGAVLGLSFSPDGKTLATSGEDGTIRFWDAEQRRPLGSPLKAHEKHVSRVAFSPDGDTLAAGNGDGSITLWRVSTRAKLDPTLVGHHLYSRHQNVRDLAFSPDGLLLASSGGEGNLVVWDVCDRKLKVHTPNATSGNSQDFIVFSPDGKMLAAGGTHYEYINFYDPATLGLRGHIPTPQGFGITDAAFSPDGKQLASSASDSTIYIWDVMTRKKVGEPLVGLPDAVRTIAFRPNGGLLAAGGARGVITLWDAAQRPPLYETVAQQTAANVLDFSRNNTRAAWGRGDGTITLWDVPGRKPAEPPLTGHKAAVTNIAFGEGGLMASADAGRRVVVWRAAGRGHVFDQAFHLPADVKALVFGEGGRTLKALDADGNLWLSDLTRGGAGATPRASRLGTLKRKVVDATFSRDGKLLAFSDARSDIFLWDMTHGASVRELLNAAVWSLAFSLEYRVPPDEAGLRTSLAFNPDGKILALGNGNGTVWLWDTGANQLVGKPLSGHLRRVNGVAFSPDGRKMLTSDEGGTVLLWDVEPAAWVERACDIANRSLTPEEWRQYARGEPYRRLCAGRPRLTPRGLSAARR